MTKINKKKSKLFWVGLCAISVASIASFVLAGPKLGLWTSLPGCGPRSGCDMVTNGPLGNIFLGSFVWPVSFVGLAWFIAVLGLWKSTTGKSRPLLWVIRLGVLGSIGFIVAMIAGGNFCKYCALVHLCNLVLWICAELRVRSGEDCFFGGFVKSFLFWFVFVSVVLGAVYLFASTKKKVDDKIASDENTKQIIEGGVDNSTLALLE